MKHEGQAPTTEPAPIPHTHGTPNAGKSNARTRPMPMKKPLDLKDRVKALRLDKKWSQEEFAERSGLSLRTVKRFEAGETMSEQTIHDIERTLEKEEVIA